MSKEQLYESLGADYSGGEFNRVERIRSNKTQRPTHARKRGKTPLSFNGIHRRRKRKLTW